MDILHILVKCHSPLPETHICIDFAGHHKPLLRAALGSQINNYATSHNETYTACLFGIYMTEKALHFNGFSHKYSCHILLLRQIYLTLA